jgi:integrase
LGTAAKAHRTWLEAVVRWTREKKHKKSLKDDLGHFRWLDPHLRHLSLQAINEDKISELIDAKLDCDVTNATVNRVLALVRSVLMRAEKQWKWLDRAPTFELLPETERIRWLTHEAAALLLEQLPPHLKTMAEFTLETGLRAANVRGLRWSNIDMQRHTAWVNADEAKAGRAIGVPLSNRAVEIVRSQLGRHLEYVFAYSKGREHPPMPITGQLCNTGWRKALQRLCYTDLRWHDLRHTWASWHMQKGTPLHFLKELGGWSDIKMVLRYAHLNTDHLRVHVERGTKLTHVDVQKKNAPNSEAVSA